MDTLSPKITLFGKTMNIKEFLTLLYTEAKTSGYDSNTGNVWCLAYQRNVSAPGIPMDQLTEEQLLSSIRCNRLQHTAIIAFCCELRKI